MLEIMNLYAKRTIVEKVSYVILLIYKHCELTVFSAQPLCAISSQRRSTSFNDRGHSVQGLKLHFRQHHTLLHGQPPSRCRLILLLPSRRVHYWSFHEHVLPTACFDDQDSRTGLRTEFSYPFDAGSLHRLSPTRSLYEVMDRLGATHQPRIVWIFERYEQ